MRKLLLFVVIMFSVLFGVTISSYAYVDQSEVSKKFELEKQILQTKDSQQEYIVKFKKGVSEEIKKSKLSSFSSQKVGSSNLGLFKISGQNAVEKTINEFKVQNSKEIEYIIPNYKRKVFLTPNDIDIHYQWGIKKIDLEKAWDYTTGSKSTVVAVIDSGVDLSHPDLQGQIVGGYNFIFRDTDIYDINGHGTFVSGIIGASTDNNLGICGVNWDVKIMPLQAVYGDGSIYDSDVIDAIIFAADNGADVINLSLGGPQTSAAIQNAIDYAIARNVTVVAAVGNDGNSTLNYPAACTGVIGVGSTNSYDSVSSFSQRNSSVDIVAPGEGITSTCITTSGYATTSGTSFSAPHVSGVAALLLSIDPKLTPSQITNILQSSSIDLGTPGRDDQYGYGRLDSFMAVKSTLKPISSIDTPTNNQSLSGIIPISGWCLDGNGVSSIDILIDDKVIGTASYGVTRKDVMTVFPIYKNENCGYAYQLNTKSLSNGKHTLTLRETGGSGIKTTLQNIAITVNNLPVLANIENPTSNQQLSGTISVNGWLLDSCGVSKIEIHVDGVVTGQAIYGSTRGDVAAAFPIYKNNNSGFTYQLNTKLLSNGQHTISIRETDKNNIQTTLPPVSAKIYNLPPVGCMDTPSNNQKVSGTVSISGWFLDEDEISTVDVLVDGTVVGQATYGTARYDVASAFPAYKNNNSGYSYKLDTKTLPNGSHTIVVRETNKIGNQIALPAVTLVINNLPVIGCIDTPANNQKLTGTVSINGWLLDDGGVDSVDILVDGAYIGKATYGIARYDVASAYPAYKNNNSGYSYNLVTSVLSEGSHSISVRSTNKYGIQTIIQTVTVTINHLPVIGCIDTPTDNQHVSGLSGVLTVSGWILNEGGVSQVDILVDGQVWCHATYGIARYDVAAAFPVYNNTNSGFTCNIDTRILSQGSHTVTVSVTNNYGIKTTLTNSRTILKDLGTLGNVDNPVQSQELSGTVLISGWFLDEIGVNDVEIVVNHTVIGHATYGLPRYDVAAVFPEYKNTNSGFSYSLDTTKFGNGKHTIEVTAYCDGLALTHYIYVVINNPTKLTTQSVPSDDQESPYVPTAPSVVEEPSGSSEINPN